MRVLRNRHCINIFKDVIDLYSFILYIRIKPSEIKTVGDVLGSESNWLLDTYKVFHGNFSNLELCDAQIAFKVDMKFGKGTLQALSQSRFLYADARIRLVQSSKKPWTVVDDLLKLHGTSFDFVRGINKSVEHVIYVMDEGVRLFEVIKRLLANRDFHGFVSSSSLEKRIDIMSEYAMTDTDGLTILPYSISYPINYECDQTSKATEINVMPFSSCAKVKVSELDIPWTQSTDGLVIKDLKIPSNEYYYIDHLHIMICVETFQKIVKHLQPKRTLDAEVIVSIISSSLSILSLLITLVVFCIIPKLRALLPGKNNMSFAAYLLVAQALLLVGSQGSFEQYTLSCKAVGIFIHYSWLCSMFWMNVCTYHMFRVLSQTKPMKTGQGWKQFIFYHIYVCIMSVLFVLANVISSVFIASNIGYGGKFCYIISEEKILLTFAIPTIFVVVLNLSMFLYVVIKIKRAPIIRRNVQNEQNQLIIFAKLSTVTGTTWIFGFLYIWSGIQALSYVFIILNASQGVFIMFAFILNRKVMLLFKERIGTWHKRRPKTQDNGTRTLSSKL
ncbi:uncharacterized protein LOC123550011 [Mercenaria mercenaria]|uniref:uncharacterized protein LOC123550011 n=1 Tax=Mercenaria mercenaria TaxID=6596 RepID=UPI00234E4FA2|nr:uncharacterized protein LOC123550011 [Mercenaria mercenaria]